MRPAAPIWPRPGHALALAAPAGAFDEDAMQAGLAALRELAPHVLVLRDPELDSRQGYLAGDDLHRAGHLTRLMTQPDFGAVLCVRGGFGCSRLLPRLDLAALAAGRRLLVGFSDVTCLLNNLAAAGLVTVHGPMVVQLPCLDRPSRSDLSGLFAGILPWPGQFEGQALAPGLAQGPLLGGNLTMLCHLLGTPFSPPLQGAVLFLEEVAEAPYRIDRLLTQLEMAGVLGQVSGVAVGWLGDEHPEAMPVVQERLAGLGIPVVAGLPFGHGSANRCLPVGALAEIDGNRGVLRVGLDL